MTEWRRREDNFYEKWTFIFSPVFVMRTHIVAGTFFLSNVDVIRRAQCEAFTQSLGDR